MYYVNSGFVSSWKLYVLPAEVMHIILFSLKLFKGSYKSWLVRVLIIMGR